MKFLKWLSITLVSLLLILIALISWCFLNPAEAFNFAQKYFFPQDLKVTISQSEFSWTSHKGLHFGIDWKLEDLLITKQKPLVNLPIQSFELKADFDFSSQKVNLDVLRLIANSPMEFQTTKQEEQEPQKKFFQQIQSIVNILEETQGILSYEIIDVQIKDFKLLNENNEASKISLNLKSEKPNLGIAFNISFQKNGASPILVDSQGLLQLEMIEKDQTFLKSKTKLKLFGVETEQNLQATYAKKAALIQLKGPVTYTKDKILIKAQPQIDLNLTSKSSELQIVTDVLGIPGPVKKIDALRLKLVTPLKKDQVWSEQASSFDLLVPIELKFFNPTLKENLQKSCDCLFPLSLTAKAAGKVWISHFFSEDTSKKNILDAQISLENVKNKLFLIDLLSDLKIEKDNTKWVFLPVLNSKITVYDFKGIRPLLDMYHILIPAPLDVLNGTVHFEAAGPVKYDTKTSEIPMKLDVNLSSQKQVVKFQSDGTTTISSDFKKIHVETRTKISDLQIELPPLNPIGGKPRVTLDKRILKIPPIKDKESNLELTFGVQVETTKPGAIRLLSEYFKPYLPLTLKVEFNPQKKNEGFIQTEPFDIVYLRRKVSVEKMKLDLSQLEDDVLPVDGRFKIQQTQYTIFIDVKGNAKNPNIVMTSEPDLSQSEIISVLLYDRTSDQLASADAETAGGVQAAVADRAIGLFGLWAFASTPIRSFSYNPVTKVYTATVDLGGDVTAGIGTTWESTVDDEIEKLLELSDLDFIEPVTAAEASETSVEVMEEFIDFNPDVMIDSASEADDFQMKDIIANDSNNKDVNRRDHDV